MRIFKRHQVWWVDMSLGNKPDGTRNRIQQSLGVRGRKDVALIKAQQLFRDLEARSVKKDPALSVVLEDFETFCKTTIAESTRTRYEDVLNNFRAYIRQAFGRDPERVHVSDLTRPMIENYKAARTRDGISPAGLSIELRTLKRCFNVALKELKLVTVNPFSGVALPRIPKKERQRFTPEEVAKVLNMAQELDARHDSRKDGARNRCPHFPLLATMAYTGTRVGEALALRWSDVDFVKRTVKVINHADHKTKTLEIRTIQLHPELSRALSALPEGKPSDRIFPIATRSAQRIVDRVLEKSGLLGHPHMFRHTVASTMLDNGATLRDVADILGQKNLKTTEIYLEALDANKREAVLNLSYGAPKKQRKVLRIDKAAKRDVK